MARLTALFACGAAYLVHAPAAFAQAGRLGGGGQLNLSLTRIVMALMLCLMLAALAALALKRSGGRIDLPRLRGLVAALPAQRRVEVIETRRVSQYADVCLLRCDGREYLVLCAQQQQTVLRESACAAVPSPSLAATGGAGEAG
ncbi:hypothetical protein ACG3SL_12870 [Sphingomonas sp. CJ20]